MHFSGRCVAASPSRSQSVKTLGKVGPRPEQSGWVLETEQTGSLAPRAGSQRLPQAPPRLRPTSFFLAPRMLFYLGEAATVGLEVGGSLAGGRSFWKVAGKQEYPRHGVCTMPEAPRTPACLRKPPNRPISPRRPWWWDRRASALSWCKRPRKGPRVWPVPAFPTCFPSPLGCQLQSPKVKTNCLPLCSLERVTGPWARGTHLCPGQSRRAEPSLPPPGCAQLLALSLRVLHFSPPSELSYSLLALAPAEFFSLDCTRNFHFHQARPFRMGFRLD